MRLFLNGVQEGSATNSNSISTGSTYGISVGRWTEIDTNYIIGYVSNFRVVKGTAVYTAAFTPPVGPLQAITNTSLLTCAYSTFRDGSSNNFTITVNGNTAVSAQNPFPLNQLPNPALGNAGNGVYNMSQYRSLLGSNQWPAVDPYFDYTTLMLHGNGTNGAQNNTFLDSSTNNFTITRNGNTTQGTFTPYGSNWSNYFDGTGDYLTVASNAAFALPGDFTWEAWVYRTGATDDTLYNTNVSNGLIVQIISNKCIVRQFGVADLITSSADVPSNAWVHIAVARSSTTLSLWINGSRVSGGTATNSTSFAQGGLLIGVNDISTNYLDGYLSSLRLVKGTAVYDPTQTTITVPTGPLTAITNTSLLTCQSNRFIDNSSNAFTITRNGDVSVQRFSPFAPTAPYSTSVIGGSGYFDGSGDTLTTSTSQIIPTGSFTVECWAYVTGASSNQKFVAQGSSGAAGRFSVGIEGGNWFTQLAGDLIQTGTPVRNQWNYVAVTYNGSTITMYVNGSSIGTVSSSANAQNTTLTIGQDWNSYITTGYIADVRISNTVRTITTPTAPYSSDGSTRLLLSMTNGGIIDNAMMNDLETVGNAQISTSVSKFGGGSIYLDGTGDWLLTRASPNLDMGTGDLTVEGWFYLTATVAVDYRMIVSDATNGNNYISIRGGGTGGQLEVNVSGTSFRLNLNNSVTINTWFHLAVVRSGSTWTGYVNGVSIGTSSSSASFNLGNGGMYVGRFGGGTAYEWPGYIDDLRITKGIARYTANFTPPTSQFQDQ